MFGFIKSNGGRGDYDEIEASGLGFWGNGIASHHEWTMKNVKIEKEN